MKRFGVQPHGTVFNLGFKGRCIKAGAYDVRHPTLRMKEPIKREELEKDNAGNWGNGEMIRGDLVRQLGREPYDGIENNYLAMLRGFADGGKTGAAKGHSEHIVKMDLSGEKPVLHTDFGTQIEIHSIIHNGREHRLVE